MPKREFPLESEVEPYRDPQTHGSFSQKRQKLHVGGDTKTDETVGVVRKLDPSIPQEAQRMKTRFKMISKGKNTVGYDEYLKQVPKSKRRRIPEHPVTPDHTLDIPNRRWQGQVKAWRISLHKYDPKDLSSVLHMEQNVTGTDKSSHNLDSNTVRNEQFSLNSMQSLQLADADVATSSSLASRPNNFVPEKCNTDLNHGDVEEWETGQEQSVDFDDSDDDLL